MYATLTVGSLEKYVFRSINVRMGFPTSRMLGGNLTLAGALFDPAQCRSLSALGGLEAEECRTTPGTPFFTRNCYF